MGKRIAKLISAVMVAVMFTSTVAFAASPPTSVTIYTNNSSATSTYIQCTGLIDGFGVNDDTSSRGLYYTLRYKTKVGSSEAYSRLMPIGTGDMGSASVNTWETMFSQRTVFSGPGQYAVKLNPGGAWQSGCYGAGKLVD